MAPTRIEVDRILCPVDFSEFSIPALERAVRLGKWFEARVEAVHIIPFAVPAGTGLPYLAAPLEATQTQRERAAQQLANLVAPFLEEGVPIVTKVLEGEPWRVILEEAASLPSDLVVMGTHGRTGLDHLLLGSVTEEVLRRTPCPVLTVSRSAPPPAPGPLFPRILCALDLTEASGRTLDVALSFASENDARITLLHVLEIHQAIPEIAPPSDGELDDARADLRKAVPEAARTFCRVNERVETGAAWREILRVADEMGADLIVMGAHTQGPAVWRVFGSTTNRVIRRATCPVLVIRETNKQRPLAQEEQAVGAARGAPRGAER